MNNIIIQEQGSIDVPKTTPSKFNYFAGVTSNVQSMKRKNAVILLFNNKKKPHMLMIFASKSNGLINLTKTCVSSNHHAQVMLVTFY